MEVSLAKREDEASGRAFLPPLDHHRRLERLASIRSHERLHTQNPIYGKNVHAASSYAGHLVGGASLAKGPPSLALGHGDSSLGSWEGPLRGLAQTPSTVLRQVKYSQARGLKPWGAFVDRHTPNGGYDSAMNTRHAAFRDALSTSHSPTAFHHHPSASHGVTTVPSPSVSHTSLKSRHHDLTIRRTPTANPSRANHTPRVDPSPSSVPHASARSLSPCRRSLVAPWPTMQQPDPTAAEEHPEGSSGGGTNPSASGISRLHSAGDPALSCRVVTPKFQEGLEGGLEAHLGHSDHTEVRDPALSCRVVTPKFQEGLEGGLEAHLGHSDHTEVRDPALSCRVVTPTFQEGLEANLEAHLGHRDHTEIRELQKSYSSTFDAKSLPVGEGMIRSEELSKLYTCFIQRRARFLVSTPLYRSLAESDRLKLLHVAVAMSTYFTGAHLIDIKDYTWKNRNGSDEKTYPVMSASTIRQFLSHEQFVYVMRFYTTYSPVFSDQTVAILMQVLSLFYPEPGLADPNAAEQGRLHYVTLLSRYLRATYGPQAGPERLRTLISSQQEARQLVDLLQHVELTPQVPRHDGVDAQRILMEGIRLVCDRARESLVNGLRERHEGLLSNGPTSYDRRTRKTSDPVNTSSVQDAERLDFIEKTFTRLANCEDPYILAEARRILPADLIRRFFQQLQCTSAPRT
ncbi:uncharacterized protein [Panulirus ornatus]